MTDEKKRLPFNEEIINLANGFTQHLIDEFPELDGIAVVFGYAVPNTALPYAVVRGQNGPMSNPEETLHLSVQLWRTLASQMDKARQMIENVDKYMGDQVVKLQKLQEKINAAEARIANIEGGVPQPAGPPGQ